MHKHRVQNKNYALAFSSPLYIRGTYKEKQCISHRFLRPQVHMVLDQFEPRMRWKPKKTWNTQINSFMELYQCEN